jgi:hypothetical protein
MAYAFPPLIGNQPVQGNVTFRKTREPNYASDYIYNKKSLMAYCIEKKDFNCKKWWNQGELFLYNNGQYLATYGKCSPYNTSNLGSNLYTKLDVSGVCVITDTSLNACSPKISAIPVLTSQSQPLYYRYNIDPSGQLFGRSPCGVNNYTIFMTPSLQGSTNEVPSFPY